LQAGQGWSEQRIRDGYLAFKNEQKTRQLRAIANSYGLELEALQAFVDHTLARMIFDGEQLGDLLAPLGLGWKDRSKKELALMADLLPLLQKLAQGREISGLQAYEQ